ncbi:MAG: diaminopimelate decarboxylase [Bacteroidales bacterium]|nr:diaminopimelate decarboxylase [Bacteroidales bacterium]
MDKSLSEKLDAFEKLGTPVWYYDLEVLSETIETLKAIAGDKGIAIHYALKANPDERIVAMMAAAGFGADCVSGGEVALAAKQGIPADRIFYAGVGKTDREIRESIDLGVRFNVESLEELYVVNAFAGEMGKTARVSLRLNPNVDGRTLKYITSGLHDNKFGLPPHDVDSAIEMLKASGNIVFEGLHFHIGSQITSVRKVFGELCGKVREAVRYFEERGIDVKCINLGGGLGIDYENPSKSPDFEGWLGTIAEGLKDLRPRTIELEPGRSLVAGCCSLISRVLFVKHGENKDFMILDAGMSELLRPALYGSFHLIENLSAEAERKAFREQSLYDIVGPICESSDTWGRDRRMPLSVRGDVVAIRSAGAYGKSMSSTYNLRAQAPTIWSDEI